MAVDTAIFVRGLNLKEADILGFSIGGFISQAFAFNEPKLFRKPILIGTGPRAGEGMEQNVRTRDKKPE